MKLFLIRHGETVDNVAGVYAGVRDSALTNHGVLQANRLGAHFVSREIKASAIFSSDLQRAFKTAEAVRLALRSIQEYQSPIETQRSVLLREQDFGFYEGKKFFERTKDSNKSGKDAHLDAHKNDPGFVDVESKEAMNARCNRFVDDHLLPLLGDLRDGGAIVIVAHGIILSHLWRCILRRFPPRTVSVVPGAVPADRALTLEHLGGWSNTGYLELELAGQDPSSSGMQLAAQSAPYSLSAKDDNAVVVRISDVVEPVALPRSATSDNTSVLPDRLDDGKADNVITEEKHEAVIDKDKYGNDSDGEHRTSLLDMDPATQTAASSSPVLSPVGLSTLGAMPPSNTPISVSLLLPPLTPSRSRLINDMTITVRAVNCIDHLIGLKKTRGGIGNLKHDEGQKSIKSFFTKKRKLE